MCFEDEQMPCICATRGNLQVFGMPQASGAARTQRVGCDQPNFRTRSPNSGVLTSQLRFFLQNTLACNRHTLIALNNILAFNLSRQGG